MGKWKNIMKLVELIETIKQTDKDSIRSGLGGRPEQFRYTGPLKIFVHWTECETWNELKKHLNKLQIGEFCMSSVKGGAINALSGLMFYGKPRFYFPFDVHSMYNRKNGLRSIISEKDLKKRTGSIIHYHLFGDEHDNLPASYDEAWGTAQEMKFIGVSVASYNKTLSQLLKDKEGLEQLKSMMNTIESCVNANISVYLMDKNVFQKITKTMYNLMHKATS